MRSRLAAFAAVPGATRPIGPLPGIPRGRQPLSPLDRLRRFLGGPADNEGEDAPRLRRRVMSGLISGLMTGLLASLATFVWDERSLSAGLVLTLVTMLATLALWGLTRSTMAAAIYLGVLLAMYWVLTPASRIVYQSDRDTGYRPQIYVTTVGGGSTDRLTSSPTLETDAHVARRSGRIVLAHYREGNTDIFLTEPDGSQPRNLTHHPSEERAPVWSPDGAEIAFQSNRSGNWDIYVMQADGSNLRKLTSSPADDQAPTWSPDGRTLAFQSDRDGFTHIYVLGRGGGVLPLTRGLYHAAWPAWSPDGRRIAFQANLTGRWQLYTIRPDGTEMRRVLTSMANDTMPAWSPDSQALVFVSDRDGNQELYTVQANGSELRRLTRTPTDETQPYWAPGGPIDWTAAQRALRAWAGVLIPALQPGDSVSKLAPPAPRDVEVEGTRPASPTDEVLSPLPSRPAPALPPDTRPLPTPTPGLRPVPTCTPGGFWC